MVSAQHRLLFEGPLIRRLFGEWEVLALAKGLVGLDRDRAMHGKREAIYFSILCEKHEIIEANAARSETFYPGPTAMRMIGPGHRHQIMTLFPKLRADPDVGFGPKARKVLTLAETKLLVAALKAQRKESVRLNSYAEYGRLSDGEPQLQA